MTNDTDNSQEKLDRAEKYNWQDHYDTYEEFVESFVWDMELDLAPLDDE